MGEEEGGGVLSFTLLWFGWRPRVARGDSLGGRGGRGGEGTSSGRTTYYIQTVHAAIHPAPPLEGRTDRRLQLSDCHLRIRQVPSFPLAAPLPPSSAPSATPS